MLHQKMATDLATTGESSAAEAEKFAIVLKPVSHPELGDIRIDDNLFAIGRGEPPFAGYAAETVADLSRRQARIFSEYGTVYIADLDSKNGTTVNGVNVQQKITRLRDGDEICFGKALSYRVHFSGQFGGSAPEEKIVSLTLGPVRDDLDLQPIVVSCFPFLISKADDVFARYKEAYPHQVNYLSRRHAHIFLKNGMPFIEDLGSTNGTFVGDNRLEERAVVVDEGDVLAFGGHHFVYRVSLQKQTSVVEPTITKLSPMVQGQRVLHESADADKTTFVAAANSFLDIFCVDQAQRQDDEINQEASQAQKDGPAAVGQARGKARVFVSELLSAFGRNDARSARRMAWSAGVVAVATLALGLAIVFTGAAERHVKELLASGDYAGAATIASQSIARDADNAQLRVLGTEALLRAYVPQWSAAIRIRDFNRAAAVLGDMKKLTGQNPDAQSLVTEIEWLGKLEQFVSMRGGADVPLRDAADEAAIRVLLKQWDDDVTGHQRSLTTVSSYVSEFRDTYAEALSRLRKLALIAGGRPNEG